MPNTFYSYRNTRYHHQHHQPHPRNNYKPSNAYFTGRAPTLPNWSMAGWTGDFRVFVTRKPVMQGNFVRGGNFLPASSAINVKCSWPTFRSFIVIRYGKKGMQLWVGKWLTGWGLDSIWVKDSTVLFDVSGREWGCVIFEVVCSRGYILIAEGNYEKYFGWLCVHRRHFDEWLLVIQWLPRMIQAELSSVDLQS